MINDTDERFMRMALEEASTAASQGEIRLGGVPGTNLTETLTDVTAHAEMIAVTAAAQTLGGKYLPDCTIYVTVEPCTMCAGALGWSHIGRIVYGTPDEKRGYFSHTCARNSVIHPKTTVESGVLEEECRMLMVDFFKKMRK